MRCGLQALTALHKPWLKRLPEPCRDDFSTGSRSPPHPSCVLASSAVQVMHAATTKPMRYAEAKVRCVLVCEREKR